MSKDTTLFGGLFKTYLDYLASDMWKEKRENMLAKHPFCYDCNMKATEVHHLSYDHVCNEPLKDLITLCRRCHKKRHNKNE